MLPILHQKTGTAKQDQSQLKFMVHDTLSGLFLNNFNNNRYKLSCL